MSADLGRLPAALARLLEAFDPQQVRGQSGTITAVVNALAKAGIELGENGSIYPRPKGKARMAGCGISGLVIAPSSQWAAWQVSGPEGVNSRPRYAALQHFKADPFCVPSRRINTTDPRPYQPPPNTIKITMMRIRSVVVSIFGLLLESDGPLASQTFKPPGIFSTLQGGGNRRMAIIPNGEICYATR